MIFKLNFWYLIKVSIYKENIKQGQRKAWRIPSPKNLTRWPWPWKSIGFQILLRTKYVPSLVKIHWRMLILECSQGCYGRTEGQTVALLYPFATSLARDKKNIHGWFFDRSSSILVFNFTKTFSSYPPGLLT